MNYSSLTIDELLHYGTGGDAEAALEIVRRLPELYTLRELEDAGDESYESGMKDGRGEAVDWLYTIIDSDDWKARLKEEDREWIKTELDTLDQ